MWRTPVARWGVRAPSLLSLLGVTPPSSQWTAVPAPLPEWRLQSLSQLATSRQWTTGKIFDNSAKNIWQNYLQKILKWLEWCQEGQDEGLATSKDLTWQSWPLPLCCAAMACDIGRIIPRWLLSTFNFIILVGRDIEVIHVVNVKQESKSLLLIVIFKCSLKWQTTCSGKTLDTSTSSQQQSNYFCLFADV